jgi:hypothetical protein
MLAIYLLLHMCAQIRQYGPQIRAIVTMEGGMDKMTGASFRALAGESHQTCFCWSAELVLVLHASVPVSLPHPCCCPSLFACTGLPVVM